MATKTIIAKIPEEDHAFLANSDVVITRLITTLVKNYIHEEKIKDGLLQAQRKKEEELYATYTRPAEPIEHDLPPEYKPEE